METTILLSKVFGLLFIITGFFTVLRRKYFISLIAVFVKEKVTRLVISLLEMLGGLFIIFTQTNFSTLPNSIISLVGYVLFIEGILYVAMSDKSLQKMINKFNNKKVYLVGGLLSVLVGLYLSAFGFGLL